jgi:hypothetical protein
MQLMINVIACARIYSEMKTYLTPSRHRKQAQVVMSTEHTVFMMK